MLTPEMLNYVKGQKAQGMSKEMIKSDLLGRGWPEAEINQALSQMENIQPPTEPQTNLQEPIVTSVLSPIVPEPKSHVKLFFIIGTLAAAMVVGAFVWQFVLKDTSEPEKTQITASKQPVLEQTPYTNEEIGFSMNFPKDWDVTQESQNKVLGLATEADADPLALIGVGKARNDDDIDTYIEKIKAVFALEDPNFAFLSKTSLNLNIGEQSAYQLMATTLIDQDKIFQSQVIVYYPDKVYIIQFSALESSWNSYYKNLFDAVVKTFRPLAILDSRLEPSAYIDKVNGYQINLPKDWLLERVNEVEIEGFVTHPKDAKKFGDDPDELSPSVTLLVAPDYGQTLEQTLDFFVKNEPGLSKITTKEVSKVNGYDAISVETEGVEENIKLKATFLLVMKSSRMYLIGGTALESDWGNYKDVFQASLSTFQLQ